MTTSKQQHRAWAEGRAADAWFSRNLKVLNTDYSNSKSTQCFASYIQTGQRILEIGCSNGYQIEKLRLLTQCEAFGVDPSPMAIADGKVKFPELKLALGTADRLEFPDTYFDAVIFGFCLCVVDRSLLMRAVAESDRVLQEWGKLMITDFDPIKSHRRPFKHHEDLWTYKMQHPDLWLANPQYVLAEKVAFSLQGEAFHFDPNERVASWVLVKQGTDAYPEQP